MPFGRPFLYIRYFNKRIVFCSEKQPKLAMMVYIIYLLGCFNVDIQRDCSLTEPVAELLPGDLVREPLQPHAGLGLTHNALHRISRAGHYLYIPVTAFYVFSSNPV